MKRLLPVGMDEFYLSLPEPPPAPLMLAPVDPLGLDIPEPPPAPLMLALVDPLGLDVPEPPPVLRPGNPAPCSGQFREIGPNGEVGPEVTSVRGRRLPPTTSPRSIYLPVDPTDNKSGRGQ
jgi:hypothetical protein